MNRPKPQTAAVCRVQRVHRTDPRGFDQLRVVVLVPPRRRGGHEEPRVVPTRRPGRRHPVRKDVKLVRREDEVVVGHEGGEIQRARVERVARLDQVSNASIGRGTVRRRT